MIFGTAGHVDHGKSSLITALTGTSMDRLAEEHRRGITIELGFTHLDLGRGQQAGIVDVPGHEDFVRTMVAGASGMDTALLVIAADDGIMPQTREHLLVVEELGIPSGIAVITKSDLVDPEWLALVKAEVDAWLGKSTTAFFPALAVSAVTGEGVDDLRALLRHAALRALPRPGLDDLFRLPVDRAFTVRGTGTVATGTTWSGQASAGDEVLVLPAGVAARVRGIEVHGQPRTTAEPATRTALALSGVGVGDVPRGSVVVHPGRGWLPSRGMAVQVRLAPSARPIHDRARVRVHLGTAEVMARVRVADTILPGRSQVARLALEAPLVARGGDRFVLRSYSPVGVIGGGTVIDPHTVSGRLASDWGTTPEQRLMALVARRRWGTSPEELAILSGEPPAAIPDAVGRAGLASVGGRIVTPLVIDELAARMTLLVGTHHREHPTEAGPSAELLRSTSGAPPALAGDVLARLVKSGALALRDGRVTLPSFVRSPVASVEQARRVLEAIVADGLAIRTVSELSRDLGMDVRSIVRELERSGSVISVDQERFVPPAVLADFREALASVGRAGSITPGALRGVTGLSRKFLIPLLEWADRAGITVRHGDERRLTPTVVRRA